MKFVESLFYFLCKSNERDELGLVQKLLQNAKLFFKILKWCFFAWNHFYNLKEHPFPNLQLTVSETTILLFDFNFNLRFLRCFLPWWKWEGFLRTSDPGPSWPPPASCAGSSASTCRRSTPSCCSATITKRLNCNFILQITIWFATNWSICKNSAKDKQSKLVSFI